MATPGQTVPCRPPPMPPAGNPCNRILGWTGAIRIGRGLGRLAGHYDSRCKVHTASGETCIWNHVVQNSMQEFDAFPNGGSGRGEDVIRPLRGTCCGIPTYGPVDALGASRFKLREWQTLDGAAILAQTHAGRAAGQAARA